MTSIITRLHHITGYGTAARVPDDSRVSVEAKVINEAAGMIDKMRGALHQLSEGVLKNTEHGIGRDWGECDICEALKVADDLLESDGAS